MPRWLGLCPDNRITGGKVIRRGARHVITRGATALRIGATTRLRSQSYLGAQYRRFRGKLGAPKAITAMAHKLAVLVYRMLRWGQEYVDKGMQYYEERHRQQQIRLLKKRASTLGFFVPVARMRTCCYLVFGKELRRDCAERPSADHLKSGFREVPIEGKRH